VFEGLDLTTGDISEKIGRGKNTTRHTQLFDLPSSEGGYIADTAGFSLLDFERFDFFELEDLAHTFREFTPYLGKCRYTDCTHMNDEECAILEAVAKKEISPIRHASYKELYTTLKGKKKYD
jgi:ribosome biogenesis GTPase